jgi:hypothetical protein
MKSRFLFEVRPDVFPHGMLTGTEAALWAMFFKDRNKGKANG